MYWIGERGRRLVHQGTETRSVRLKQEERVWKKPKRSLARQVGSGTLKAIRDMPRILVFIVKAVGIHWRSLGRKGHDLICVTGRV